ncbi:MAG: hypothetical protein OXG99_03775 [Alphaproteobacteria bacterium]|nr:hypothetical protein [Alphaproteobacteria bacterium]
MAQRRDTPESPAAGKDTVAGRAALLKEKYGLSELVDRIAPENRHPEVDFGKPEGEEQR